MSRSSVELPVIALRVLKMMILAGILAAETERVDIMNARQGGVVRAAAALRRWDDETRAHETGETWTRSSEHSAPPELRFAKSFDHELGAA